MVQKGEKGEVVFKSEDEGEASEAVMTKAASSKTRQVAVPPATAAASAGEVAQLRELTEALIGAVNAMQAPVERDPEISSLIASVGAVTRTMRERTAAMSSAGHAVSPIGVAEREDCDCGPCGCLSSDCCKFKVEVTHARAIEMQIPLELADSNVNPFGKMEIRFFASILGVGGVHPNSFSTIQLRKNLNKPGMWVTANCNIGTIEVCKGKPKYITVDVEAIEADVSADLLTETPMGRDEHGTGSVPMVLDCCTSVPVTATVEVHLDHNGLGGGAIELKIVATKVCC